VSSRLQSDLSKCELCPRCCGVDRNAGAEGYCGAGAEVEIFRYGVHNGEEPPLSGTRGSGTVFFSRCTLKCLYCQNYPWSQEGKGRRYSAEELEEVFRALARDGCHNWNLVSPTPWLVQIEKALDAVRKDGISFPVVYNTSGFERVEIIERLRGLVDVYLTDLRYSRESSAEEGSGTGKYVASARAALKKMFEAAGPLKLDGDGMAVSGTICRLLILPGRAVEAVENLEWMAREIGNGVAVSVMAQYVPAHKAVSKAPWNRNITEGEYGLVCDAVDRLGFSAGWIQDYEKKVSEDFAGFRMKEGTEGPPGIA